MPDSECAVLVAPSSPVPTIDGGQVYNFPSLMLRPSQECTTILERRFSLKLGLSPCLLKCCRYEVDILSLGVGFFDSEIVR